MTKPAGDKLAGSRPEAIPSSSFPPERVPGRHAFLWHAISGGLCAFLFAFILSLSKTNLANLTVVPSDSITPQLSGIVPDVFITVYSYDRPKFLLNLLREISLNAASCALSVGVHVLDDNSLGCIPIRTPSSNFFETVGDPKIGHSDEWHVSQLAGAPHQDPNLDVNGSRISCPGRERLQDIESFVNTKGDSFVAGNTSSSSGPWRLFIAHYRHGRRRHWHLVRLAHQLLRTGSATAQYYIFLPDDVRLATKFLDRASAAWDAIDHARRMSLMLHIEASRVNSSVWTDFEPERETEDLVRIGWVESGNFIAGPDFLRFLNWSFPRVPIQRWIDNPPISSGVGSTLSELLHTANYRMYRTQQSLVAHVGVSSSKMNSAFREAGKPAHVTLGFVDGEFEYARLLEESRAVCASIASTWNREASLHVVIGSLAPQVDHIYVYLNGYDIVPAFLNVPFITALLSSDSSRGDIGDIGKFAWANELKSSFHMTADDDILYPPDYVDRLIEFWGKYEPPLVVGVHGIKIIHERLLPPNGRRGRGYYGSREVFMATERVPNVHNVHILGSGTMLYRVQDVGPIDIDTLFRKPNMADIWFAIHAQQNQLPLATIPHEAGWLQEVPGTFEDSIYKQSTKRRRKGDHEQTTAAKRAAPWKVYLPKLKNKGTPMA